MGPHHSKKSGNSPGSFQVWCLEQLDCHFLFSSEYRKRAFTGHKTRRKTRLKHKSFQTGTHTKPPSTRNLTQLDPAVMEAEHKKRRYFVVKAPLKNLDMSLAHGGVWATQRSTQALISAAMSQSQVVLLFSGLQSGGFQTCGPVTSAPGQPLPPHVSMPQWEKSPWITLGDAFLVDWQAPHQLPFSHLRDMTNPLCANKPLHQSRDGDELDAVLGHRLCEQLAQVRPARPENRRRRSRSRSRDRASRNGRDGREDRRRRKRSLSQSNRSRRRARRNSCSSSDSSPRRDRQHRDSVSRTHRAPHSDRKGTRTHKSHHSDPGREPRGQRKDSRDSRDRRDSRDSRLGDSRGDRPAQRRRSPSSEHSRGRRPT
eukprot:g27745.t1